MSRSAIIHPAVLVITGASVYMQMSGCVRREVDDQEYLILEAQ